MIDMTPNLVLVVVIAVLVTTGVYLVLERSLSRVLLGIVLISNGVNLLFLVAGGRAGTPPLVGSNPPESMSDPLPQAMVLTAIVISLGMVGFVLAMAYRSWQLHGHDEVQDDLEDRRIVRRAILEAADAESINADSFETLDEEAALVRDETDGTDEPDEPDARDTSARPPSRAPEGGERG